MLAGTAENKMFTLDGGGGTSIFGQGQPYFWGTRAITPNDPMPGLFEWLQGDLPGQEDASASWAGTSASPTTAIIKEDILKKIADAGYEFNGLYELVPVGGQDFSQVLPKIKANEPDILLGQHLRPGPRFVRQPGGDGRPRPPIRIGFEFTPDGVNASKGTYDTRRLHVRLRLLRRRRTRSARWPRCSSSDFNAEYGEDPDFYAANFYENAFVMWEVMRRIWAKDRRRRDHGDALDEALQENLTVVSVYGGDESTRRHVHPRRRRRHSVTKREHGRVRVQGRRRSRRRRSSASTATTSGWPDRS